MAYCSTTELVSLTGAEDDAASLAEIIAQADRMIDARLSVVGLSGSSSSPAIKGASLNFSIAGLMTRHRTDGKMPGSISVGGLSMGDNIDAAISTYQQMAKDLIAAYVAENASSSTKTYVVKANG